ncbi:hypothetical protein NUW58_g8572 [Xylaria curta]|uniref:Uncharacterized protein n=1 Tax=Xylaria curta TaxID=42375 RepID=A0ACC1N630_9PEZI|nr:hypothetical protein NUW58_g8572 [Xylaria curta]
MSEVNRSQIVDLGEKEVPSKVTARDQGTHSRRRNGEGNKENLPVDAPVVTPSNIETAPVAGKPPDGADQEMREKSDQFEGPVRKDEERSAEEPGEAAQEKADSTIYASGQDAKKTTFPALVIKDKVVQADTNRVKEIVVEVPKDAQGGLFIAWLGPWGGLKYTSVDATDGSAVVPDSLNGHVWAVLTNKEGVKAADIDTVTVAGPEVIWVSQQWSVADL